jgi:hypothetical protein
LSAYKTQLHGNEWIVSLSADLDQCPPPKKMVMFVFLKNLLNLTLILTLLQ